MPFPSLQLFCSGSLTFGRDGVLSKRDCPCEGDLSWPAAGSAQPGRERQAVHKGFIWLLLLSGREPSRPAVIRPCVLTAGMFALGFFPDLSSWRTANQINKAECTPASRSCSRLWKRWQSCFYLIQ